MNKTMNKKSQQSGFTLIELLVVIGIIAVLAAIVIVAVNPKKQFEAANNSARKSNLNAIINAIGQYTVDKKGSLPPGLPAAGAAAIDIPPALCTALMPTFIPAIPTDPKSTDYGGEGVTTCADLGGKDTDYEVAQDAAGRVTVSAPLAESGETIEITR
jgi:prepilin-type N-terminal cleavage/methylation domain-containing protein